ncbi:MAG: PEP-CTERM sorting domain-containing protein [Verrucomicrobiales bacterium]|nr:PEP-CTERM sorting domain-containing protein [Verrucomicrobiales bacterium]
MTKAIILIITALCLFGAVPEAEASLIFQGGDANTNLISNGVGGNGSKSGGPLSFTNFGDNNNNTGIASIDSIDTLLGTALAATDVVTLNATITSTGNLRANGIEFGLSPSGTDFRPVNNLLFRTDVDGDPSGMALNNFPGLGSTDAGFGVDEASLRDGFNIALVADVNGFTVTITDVIGTQAGFVGDTTLIYNQSTAFTGNEFLDNFGGGHIYLTAQGNNITTTLSDFSIDVTPVPEPSTVGLMLLLTGSGLLLYHRRRSIAPST